MLHWIQKSWLLILFSCFATQAIAGAQLRDVGVVGLMSHDVFAWDHEKSVNTENGRLDLSTIFDYEGGKLWEKGGNPKNCENSPVCTITMQLVEFHKNELKSKDEVAARKNTVIRFQNMVKETYVRLSGLPLPTVAKSEPVNNTEQSALRGMHDLLPGKVHLYDRPFFSSLTLTNPLFAKIQLNEKELNQELKPFDGDYDQEYKEIKIPFTNVVLNLKEIDRKFIETQSSFIQADMLSELAKVGKGELEIQKVSFIHHITDILAKGLCSKKNTWIAADLSCD